MKYYSIILLCIITLTTITASFAQNTSVPSAEQIYTHFDRDFYTTGEDIWYKIYFLNAQKISSSIVHVDILNTEGNSVYHQQHEINNNTAYGDIHIPADWDEGNYLIRIYTLYNLNFGKKYIYKKIIPIYNVFKQKTALANAQITNKPTIKKLTDADSSVKIKLTQNKKNYTKREKIVLEISIFDKNELPISANLSLRAVHKKLLPDLATHSICQVEKNYQELLVDLPKEFPYQPQKNLQLLGKILDSETLQTVKSNLLTAYFPDIQKNILFSSIDEYFTISLPDFKGKKPLQIFDYYPGHDRTPKVELIAVSDIIEDEVTTLPSLENTMLVTPYLNHVLKVNQINHLFDRPIFQIDDTPLVFNDKLTPDNTYVVDEYQPFDSLIEFVRETGYAFVRIEQTSENKPTIRLLGKHKDRYPQSPLFMINNYLTDEEDIVLNFPIKEVEKVDLFTNPVKLGNMFLGTYKTTALAETNEVHKRFYSIAQNGVLGVQTYNMQMPAAILNAPNNILMNGFPINRDFSQNHHDNFKKNNTKIPEFLPLAYWNPEIMTDENGKASITFYTSDLLGDFLIEVEGITSEGKTVEGIVEYSVLK